MNKSLIYDPIQMLAKVSVNEIIGALSKRTLAAVIINSPNNPTGVVYPREMLEELASILKEYSVCSFASSFLCVKRISSDGL